MASVPEVGVEHDSTLKRAFVVVGMHRSGTSAMTRTLSLLGAGLPAGLMPAVEKNNECGFWEAQSVADLNDEILQALDSEWDDVFGFRPREYLSNFDRFYLGRAVELLDEEFNGSEVIALKDPRISILTTFWERALQQAGYSTHYIIMVRNPLEVAESLRMRDEFPREKSLLLWSSYMIAVDRDTRDQDRIFVSYDQLMNDWRAVKRRIEDSAGFPFPRDTATATNEIDRFLNRRLRHFETAASEVLSRSDIPDAVKTLYRIFSAACEGVEIDRAALDAIESELAKMDLMLGPLLADLRGRVRSLAREIGELNGAKDGAIGRADSLERELAAERTLRQQEAEAAKRANHERLHALETHLAATEAERRRVTADLQSKEREAIELAGRLAEAVAELEKERLAADVARDASSRREAELNAGLSERMAELEKERLAADVARDASSRREAELNTGLSQRVAEIGKLSRKLRESQAEIEQVRDALKVSETAVEEARVDSEAVQVRLDGRFTELATLTRLLAEQETRERQSRQEADWLREAASILLNDSASSKGGLMRFLPAMFYFQRQRKKLERKGLFDAEAYLAANADVAADRADPLRHYLTHGISENRRRG